jgi:hypothetical protein
MASRTSAAARYIIEELASPEETRRLFNVSVKRAATLATWAADALRTVEPTSRKGAAKRVKSGSKRVAKKSSAKRRPSK